MANFTNASKQQDSPGDMWLDLTKGIDSFAELYDLLEEYGPAWYSEAVHVRAQSAVTLLKDLRARRPISRDPN